MAIATRSQKHERDDPELSESTYAPSLDGVRILSPQEAWEIFDAQAREHLGMSADEFDQRWKRGALRSKQEDPRVRRVLAVRVKRP